MIHFAHSIESHLESMLREAIPTEKWLFAPLPAATESDALKASLDTTVLVGSGANITAEGLQSLPHLQWVHSVSAGVDTLPLKYMREHGILLSNSRGIHGKPIAEQILGMMLSFSRQLHHYWKNQEERHWERQYFPDELSGKTLLILGAGSIGRELARKAKTFDMTIMGVNTHGGDLSDFHHVLSLDSVNTVLPETDYLVVLLPLTQKTHHFVDHRRLSLLKPSAVVINFGRGPVVDQAALTQALSDGTIRGAGLDVFEDEPLPHDSPLWEMDDVLITPHTGGWTPHYNERLVEIFLANWRSFLAHEPLVTGVDLDAGY